MTTAAAARTGGQILVDALKIHGVDTVFCVPGESYLAALDALYDAGNEIRLIACRHESGAAFMAEAYGKLTGRPGVCFVTRAPGACNASIGVHTGQQDSTPMIVLVGQVARDQVERESFQEIDYRRMYGQLAKWVAQVDDPARLPEMVSHAFHLAMAGRPGPVALALPEDMLAERAEAEDTRPYKVVQASPSAADMARLRELLAAAERPMMLLGGGGWTAAASGDLIAFAEANNLPTACSFRCQDRFDNDHPNYAGDAGIGINPRLKERLAEADLVLVVGARLGEMTTQGYTLFEVPMPRQRLVHVHPGAEELGRVFQAELPINSGVPQFAAMARALPPVDGTRWREWAEGAHRDYLANLEPETNPGPVEMTEIIRAIRERLPAEAILVNDAGNFSGWAHRYYRFRRYGTQLGPTNGAMGYGLPAAIAAKTVHPERTVVCISGDGGFLMTGSELSTAMQQGIDPVILVINNGLYGTIRMHQERDYPGRIIATDLANPDFAAYARAFGCFAETVSRTEEFAPAFDRALAAGRAALIEIKLDPEAITTRTTLSAIREKAQSAKR